MAFKMANNNESTSNSTEWFNNQFTREEFEKAAKSNLPKGCGNIITINDSFMIDSKIGINVSQCVDIDLSKLTTSQKATLFDYLLSTAVSEDNYRNGFLRTMFKLFVWGGWKASKLSHSTAKKGGIKL